MHQNIVEIAPYFSSFPQYVHILLTSGVKLHIHLINVVVRVIFFFLDSANLIGRGTDILKYFRESLGLRDKMSRLYFTLPGPFGSFGFISK